MGSHLRWSDRRADLYNEYYYIYLIIITQLTTYSHSTAIMSIRVLMISVRYLFCIELTIFRYEASITWLRRLFVFSRMTFSAPDAT